MNFLIDGHNLIGQMPGISLADPDDEWKLVLILRRYAVAKRGRKLIVVFDNGVYGHPGNLNGFNVTCHFARSPQDADTQLAKRIRATARPREWTLISSDRAVAQVAQDRGMRVISSHDFAKQLVTGPQPRPDEEKPRAGTMGNAELNEWLVLFGEAPELPPEPPPAPDTAESSPQAAPNNAAQSGRRRGRKRRS